MEFTVDAVLFDMDGVLVDSSASVERHWRAFALRHQLDPETLLSGIHGRRSPEIIREHVPAADQAAELAWMESLELDDAADLSVLPGARDMTNALAPSPWAVVTSGARSIAHARLAWAELTLPEVLVTSDDVLLGKPDPACYLQAAERLGVAPQKCLVFEDAPAGLAAARAAQMVAIGLSTTHGESEMSAANAMVVDLSHVTLRRGSPVTLEVKTLTD
jgi:sugar-phosphatase